MRDPGFSHDRLDSARRGEVWPEDRIALLVAALLFSYIVLPFLSVGFWGHLVQLSIVIWGIYELRFDHRLFGVQHKGLRLATALLPVIGFLPKPWLPAGWGTLTMMSFALIGLFGVPALASWVLREEEDTGVGTDSALSNLPGPPVRSLGSVDRYRVSLFLFAPMMVGLTFFMFFEMSGWGERVHPWFAIVLLIGAALRSRPDRLSRDSLAEWPKRVMRGFEAASDKIVLAYATVPRRPFGLFHLIVVGFSFYLGLEMLTPYVPLLTSADFGGADLTGVFLIILIIGSILASLLVLAYLLLRTATAVFSAVADDELHRDVPYPLGPLFVLAFLMVWFMCGPNCDPAGPVHLLPLLSSENAFVNAAGSTMLFGTLIGGVAWLGRSWEQAAGERRYSLRHVSILVAAFAVAVAEVLDGVGWFHAVALLSTGVCVGPTLSAILPASFFPTRWHQRKVVFQQWLSTAVLLAVYVAAKLSGTI